MTNITRSALVLGGLMMVSVAMAGSVTHRDDQAPGTADEVNRGKELYATCAGCHGADGEGKVGTAPRLNSASYLSVVSNGFLMKTIKEGRTGTNMMAWGAAMSDVDIKAVVSYIRTWQSTDGLELDESELTGTAEQGATLYRDICSRCHGRSAAGYSEAGSGTGIGRQVFLGQATDGMLRGIIKTGKDNTAMRPFSADSPVAVANLEKEQIDSIIKYLRKNAW
jgi:cytochrome c oxidase cbb3-type subunit 3